MVCESETSELLESVRSWSDEAFTLCARWCSRQRWTTGSTYVSLPSDWWMLGAELDLVDGLFEVCQDAVLDVGNLVDERGQRIARDLGFHCGDPLGEFLACAVLVPYVTRAGRVKHAELIEMICNELACLGKLVAWVGANPGMGEVAGVLASGWTGEVEELLVVTEACVAPRLVVACGMSGL
jgi:hypothetical protein